jgi:prephenate dehydrogenase
MISSILIIGTGLIGTSLALALKRTQPGIRVIGIDPHAESLDAAIARGAVDHAGSMEHVSKVDVVVLAAPVRQITLTLAAIAPLLRDHTIITDVGSTKQDVIAAARSALANRVSQFVPAHPIAGREQHGPAAADALLFDGKKTIITPLAENNRQSIGMITKLWEQAGASVVEMDASTHDAVFAAVSHLPHMLAFTMVNELASRPNAKTLFSHAASGFRDFTRIASSSPEMWRDIALNNRDALLQEFDQFLLRANEMRELIASRDENGLREFMRQAEKARGYWLSGQWSQFNNVDNDANDKT